jgi:two-component system response regulator AtoC
MSDMDGFALLAEISRRHPAVPAVVLTAHGTVAAAVEAIRAGAADFVLKPFERDELLRVVDTAFRRNRCAPAAGEVGAAPEMIGPSDAMRAVHGVIARAAPKTATVLIRGESGTGKELVARSLHDRSARRSGPFIKVHCGALPDTLLESELFGHEKGAFTGAANRKAGRVELSHGGTLFLDEIGDITPAMQVKLLRVLQEREFERLGGNETVRVDVRFVAATHRNLEAMVVSGEFREDLFYRLAVVPIWVPPLRERRADIPGLVRYFCRQLAARGDRRIDADEQAIDLLTAQPWPGNVRQLQNFVERLVVLSDGPRIGASQVMAALSRPLFGAEGFSPAGTDTLVARRRAAERAAVEEALRRAGNNRTRAARLLGVSRRTLYKKLAALGMS